MRVTFACADVIFYCTEHGEGSLSISAFAQQSHMRTSRTIALANAVLALFVMTSRGEGAFINGRESFPGAVKDTITWEQWMPNAISQNNGLTINTVGGGNADYTTRNLTVGPGQLLRVPVTVFEIVDNASPAVYVLLTSNSERTFNSSFFDNAYVGIGDTSRSINTIKGQYPSGYGAIILSNPQPIGETYIWEIDRHTNNSATFTIRDLNENVLGSYTDNNLSLGLGSSFPDQLHISLYTQRATAVFSYVEIRVPESELLPVILPAIILAAARRRVDGD